MWREGELETKSLRPEASVCIQTPASVSFLSSFNVRSVFLLLETLSSPVCEATHSLQGKTLTQRHSEDLLGSAEWQPLCPHSRQTLSS